MDKQQNTTPESNTTTTTEAPKRNPGSPFIRAAQKTLSVAFSLAIIGFAAIVLMLLYLRSQALPVTKIIQTSQIYDVQGELIDSIRSGQNRELVSLADISPHLIQATLAIEDRRFYDHPGVDFKGIARAALVNLQHMSKVQGAGTITQQLARNLYLDHTRVGWEAWVRKGKETLLALQIESQYTKDQILEQYLNQIYYGHSTYGIQAAANVYYGKDAKDLTLAESALLAGVPKGPKYYSPYMDEKNAKDRQKIVLQTMVETGYITQEEARAAASEPLTFKPLESKKPSEAPYFRDYVRQIAIQKLGITEDQFDEGGIKIYTTLDLRAQKIAEDVMNKQLASMPELQGALVAVDPRNGYIKAMVGGRNYTENQFNRVINGARQPGSSFKPFVYMTALQQPGFTPMKEYKSEPTTFTYDNGNKTYEPSNFGNVFHGDIMMREAISMSDNIYAVDTIMEVGPSKVIETARKLGIRSSMQPVPSLALGTFPVSPLEMASAYGTIANLGERVEPTAIVRIEDPYGKILYEAAPAREKAVEPQYAYVLTHLMQSVFDPGGTANRVAATLKRPIAAKTGSTNTDAWMVGFSPELATAVWLGYDKDRSISALESYKAAPIFAEFTEGVLDAVPPKQFPVPEGAVLVAIDPATGKLSNMDCPNSKIEAFIKGTEPSTYCTNAGAKDKKPTGRSFWEDFKKWFNN